MATNKTKTIGYSALTLTKISEDKYKALKELENETPNKGIASPFRVPRNTLSRMKN